MVVKKVSAVVFSALLSFAFLSCSSESNSGDENGNVNVPTKGKSADELLKAAVASLKESHYDEAIAYYDAAYENYPNDPRTAVYSALANLAKISTDPKVLNLMRNRIGFSDYPNRLNALFSDKWLKGYPERIDYYYCNKNEQCGYWYDEDELDYYDLSEAGYYRYDYNNRNYTLISKTPKYDTINLPEIKIPSWINKSEGTLYESSLLSGNIFGADAWAISLFAHLLDKNTNGLNDALDEVTDAVFGASYNTAMDRINHLEKNKDAKISLDPYFIEQLGLEDVFDEYDSIGWAEINIVSAATLALKASLEWVSSYNWNSDLSDFKFLWKAKSGDAFLDSLKKIDAKKLPFNSDLLKPRSGKMSLAKADFIKAIQSAQGSYEYIKESPLYPSKVKESYSTINTGMQKLITAINNGEKFWIPEDPTSGSWPVADGEDVIGGIDLGNFFKEGYLSLNNLFETESGKPVFYTDDDDYYKVTANNYAEVEELYLKLKANTIKALILGKETEDIKDQYINLGITDDWAQIIFEKYYK
ncbi:hypothetical protein AGMMS49938_04050 [Fibrobacterales bacterium]|nr:hypothetical protein AGMMS49938_04050 [Fibrobacterales bacterium]